MIVSVHIFDKLFIMLKPGGRMSPSVPTVTISSRWLTRVNSSRVGYTKSRKEIFNIEVIFKTSILMIINEWWKVKKCSPIPLLMMLVIVAMLPTLSSSPLLFKNNCRDTAVCKSLNIYNMKSKPQTIWRCEPFVHEIYNQCFNLT